MDDLESKVRRLLEDDGLCRRLGAAGRRAIETEFTTEIMAQGAIDAVRFVTGRGGGAGA